MPFSSLLWELKPRLQGLAAAQLVPLLSPGCPHSHRVPGAEPSSVERHHVPWRTQLMLTAVNRLQRVRVLQPYQALGAAGAETGLVYPQLRTPPAAIP